MDVPIALFSLWTMWHFASLWQKPTKRNALLLGASLAGALVTKFSAVFLFPAMFLAWVWFRHREQRSNTAPRLSLRTHLRRETLAVGAVVLASILVYAFYFGIFYRSDPRTILENEWNSLVSGGLRALPIDSLVRRMTYHPALKSLLLPLALYAGGLAYVVGHESRPVYLLGHWHPHGVWFYFPVVSFFKLAPGMLLLFVLLVALAATHLLGNRRTGLSLVPEAMRFHVRATLSGLIVFAGIAMSSKLNVGIRHFSVPITFALLLCALLLPLIRSVIARQSRPFLFGATAALAFSCLVTALLTYPHYLSYYNIFRLNMPKREIAVSSNLSWGQSMPELATFFRDHEVQNPYVDSEMSPVEPSIYIFGARDWQCPMPAPTAPAWVAVSTTNLVSGAPNCEQLLHYPSWSVGDGAVMVFHISNSAVAASR
jgi:hypothetical protein